MHYDCSREISRVLEIGFRNPQPKINSNAQEFIKEARQSAFEKTHLQFPAKTKGTSASVPFGKGRKQRAKYAYRVPAGRRVWGGAASCQGPHRDPGRPQKCPLPQTRAPCNPSRRGRGHRWSHSPTHSWTAHSFALQSSSHIVYQGTTKRKAGAWGPLGLFLGGHGSKKQPHLSPGSIHVRIKN